MSGGALPLHPRPKRLTLQQDKDTLVGKDSSPELRRWVVCRLHKA